MLSIFGIIAYAILGYCLLYIIVSTYIPYYLYLITPGCKSEIDGFTNKSSDNSNSTPAEISPIVKLNADKLADSALVSKYRPDYESILINLENSIENNMIKHISDSAKTITDNPSSISSIRRMEEINTMFKFIDNVNSSMSILDKT
jgi:hypothetical protein